MWSLGADLEISWVLLPGRGSLYQLQVFTNFLSAGLFETKEMLVAG